MASGYFQSFSLFTSEPTKKEVLGREKVKVPTFPFHPSLSAFQMERKEKGEMSWLMSKPEKERQGGGEGCPARESKEKLIYRGE